MKYALVTGGSRGIGRAISVQLAKDGFYVLINYVSNTEEANITLKQIEEDGGKAELMQFDVSDPKNIEEVLGTWVNNNEDKVIEVLINNAGITKDNLLMRISEADFDAVMEVNLKSVFNMTKAVIRPMMKQRKGSIINMSSVVGVKGNAGQTNYAASKAGILGFTKSVALELGSRNIRCNAIAPGFIETEMTAKLDDKMVDEWRKAIPLKRGGTPEDVANACVFLASDNSAYITGQTLNVDGGMLT
jgi:3-oxoacyl-[acyl-carrier protein] reductase